MAVKRVRRTVKEGLDEHYCSVNFDVKINTDTISIYSAERIISWAIENAMDKVSAENDIEKISDCNFEDLDWTYKD